MKKIKCFYCGVSNFAEVSACFNCKKPFSKTTKGFSRTENLNSQNHYNFKSTNRRMIGQSLFILLLLGGIGVGSFWGYGHYHTWLERQKNIKLEKQNREIVEKEQKEIEDFQRLSFGTDIDSTANAFLKLPARFRVYPPDLDTINSFPFRKQVVNKIRAQATATGYSSPSHNAGQVIGSSGSATFTTGGWSGGEAWTTFSNAQEFRMLKVKKILGYTYKKDASQQLLVHVSFIGLFQSVIRNGDYGGCGGERANCVESHIMEGKGELQAVRINDTWEIIFVKGSSRYASRGVEWDKETAHLNSENQQSDLIPNWEVPEISLIENPNR